MKAKIILFLSVALLSANSSSWAQSSCITCDCILAKARSAQRLENYELAIKKYDAARSCFSDEQPEKVALVDKEIIDLFNEINRLKEQALDSKIQAEIAKEQEAQARKRLEIVARKAEIARNEANEIARQAKEAEGKAEEAKVKAEEAKVKAEQAEAVANQERSKAQEYLVKLLLGQIRQIAQYDATLALRLAFETSKMPLGPEKIGLIKLELKALLASKNDYYYKLVFHGHTQAINSLAISPDGKFLATASEDQTVRVWNIQTGDQLKVLRDHHDFVDGLAFSADGKFLVSGGNDGLAIVWNAHTGEKAYQFSHGIRKLPINGVAFSPDGNHVVTCSEDNTAIIWRLGERDIEKVRSLNQHSAGINNIVCSPDGNFVLTSSQDRTAILWDFYTGQMLQQYEGHENAVDGIAFSPDGKRIVTGSDDGTAKVWDRENGHCLLTLMGHEKKVNGVAFSPDGRYILTGSKDRTARLWDADKGEAVGVFRGHSAAVDGVAFSPDGGYVITASSDNTAKLWELEFGPKVFQREAAHSRPITSSCWSPDGKEILSGGLDGLAILWNVNTQEVEQIYKLKEDSVRLVAISPLNDKILIGSDTYAYLYNKKTQELIRTLHPEGGRLTSLAFSPDGKRILLGSEKRGAALWDTTGIRIRAFSDSIKISQVHFSPNEKHLLTVNQDKTAFIWDINGRRIIDKQDYPQSLNSVCFYPDGSSVVIGAADGTAFRWGLEDGKKEKLMERQGEVVRVACSPTARKLLIGYSDNAVFLLDAKSKEKTDPFYAPMEHNSSLAFSPDGDQILFSGGKTAIRTKSLGKQAESNYYGKQQLTNAVTISPDSRFALMAEEIDSVTLILVDIQTGITKFTLPGHTSSVIAQAFSPDGKFAITGSREGDAIIWDLSSGQDIERLSGHNGEIKAVAISPDNRLAATAGEDGKAILWERESGEKLDSFDTIRNNFTSLAFSPDSRYLALGDENGEVKIVECWTSRLVIPDKPFGSTITVLAFLPGQEHVLVGSRHSNSNLSKWNFRTNDQIWYSGHEGEVSCIALSSDGNFLISGGEDKSVKLWNARSGELLTSYTLTSKPYQASFYSGDNRYMLIATEQGDFQLRKNLLSDLQSKGPIAPLSMKQRLEYQLLPISAEMCMATGHIEDLLDGAVHLYSVGSLHSADSIAQNILAELPEKLNAEQTLRAVNLFTDNDRIDYADHLMEEAFRHYRLASSDENPGVYVDEEILTRISYYFSWRSDQNFAKASLPGKPLEEKLILFNKAAHFKKLTADAFLNTTSPRLTADDSTYIASQYGVLAFYYVFACQPENAIIAANKGLEYDSSLTFIYTNLVLGYLYSGRYEEAIKTYKKWCAIPYGRSGGSSAGRLRTFGEVFIKDIRQLQENGIDHPDTQKALDFLEECIPKE